MAKVIRTNIKFKKNEQGHLYGFVTKVKGSWRGVHEEDKEVKKKIVLVDPMAETDIVPDRLYHCSLVPMECDNGFVVMNAKVVTFHAKIDTFASGDDYHVDVKFGHKIITYDPSSQLHIKNNMQSIADMLRKRWDLVKPMEVADNFLDAATIVLTLYKRNKGGKGCSPNQ